MALPAPCFKECSTDSVRRRRPLTDREGFRWLILLHHLEHHFLPDDLLFANRHNAFDDVL